MSPKPAGIFARDAEWTALERFMTAAPDRIGLGVVSGRRRHGKSFLLRHLVESSQGFYHQAVELDRHQSLERFAKSLAERLRLPGSLRFDSWETALRTAFDASLGLIVLDEFPYLVRSSPELPSVLQLIIDDSVDLGEGGQPGRRQGKLIVCGSSLSVMSSLLAGSSPLRGRAVLDMAVQPFDFRTSAAFWGLAARPEAAFAVDAMLGGAPGYRALMGGAVPDGPSGIGEWLGAGPLDPAHALFTEDEYLLGEEATLTDRSQYLSLLTAIADGATTSGRMAAAVGRDSRSMHHPLLGLERAGFVERTEDALRDRRPLYRLSDPVVRLTRVVTRPEIDLLEQGRWPEAMQRRLHAIDSNIYGPHFEHLARQFTRRFAERDTLGGVASFVAGAVINDPAVRRTIELDVVAVEHRSSERPAVLAIGEAKHTTRRRGIVDLERLVHARELVRATRSDRYDIAAIKLLLFSFGGFDAELTSAALRREDVELIDLDRLYAGH